MYWSNIKTHILYICVLLFTSCINKDPLAKHSTDSNQWTQHATSHFQLRAQAGVRSRKKLKAIGEKMDAIQQELLTLLNETEKQRLVIFLLKDKQTLTSYTGFPANGYTDTQKGIIYFVDKEPFHLALRHETMHALSWRLWGVPNTYWLSEGLAVYASGNCGNYHLHSLAHALNKQGKITDIKSLTQNFDFRALEPSLQAASMVKFIYEEYGVSTLKYYWKNGFSDTSDGIKLSIQELKKNWKNHIAQEKFNTRVELDSIKESGCE